MVRFSLRHCPLPVNAICLRTRLCEVVHRESGVNTIEHLHTEMRAYRGGPVSAAQAALAVSLRMQRLICRPADPEAKGIVERAHDHLERSFLPGRTFASPADFNAQLRGWLASVNRRHRRVLGCAPAERIDADRAAMLALPPIPPRLGWSNQIRLGRDYYVRVDTSDYSVDPNAIGRQVAVTADLERVAADES